jgi:mRNA interferase YafQ
MKKYNLVFLNRFKKDLKQCVKRNLDISKMNAIVEMLLAGEKLPEKYQDHSLSGKWIRHHECHIQPDWLLVYLIEDDVLVLTLTRTGTHSDLF